jgi:hypothetical protein
LNPRPSGYEPDELPGCSTPRLGIAYIHPLVSLRNRKVSFLTPQTYQIIEQRASPVVIEKEPGVETLG